MSDKILDKIPFYKAPKCLKVLTAKVLYRMMTLENLQNDIVLFNELDVYIKTNGRPTTSNPNYWLNNDQEGL